MLTYSILAYVKSNRIRLLSASAIKSFWFYIKFNLIKFRYAIFRYVTDLRKILISGLLTYLLTYLLRPALDLE